ncbi:MAG: GIY-YIG nuclease family protein [Actinobacteria bacterium]|nr:GIY-YIG nuclease family protein [Actinomycetota bacterium]
MMSSRSEVRTPGSYLLLLELAESREIEVGKLGVFSFPAGWYVYAGSAMSGIEQRVSRHLRPSAVRRWHLDYLRAYAPIREVLRFPGTERRECELATTLTRLPSATVPAPRFGASDCRCRTHLVYFAARPSLEEIS